MGAFKAYDIRGVFGRDFDGDTVYRIGRCLPELLEADRILIGYDCRESTPEILHMLTKGITESGADVDDMGLATTPMVYYLTATRGYSASVQITASHNSREYNGLKISRSGALPVGRDTGLLRLEAMVKAELPEPAELKGSIERITDGLEDYVSFVRRHMEETGRLKFGIDCSNGMASLLVHDLFGEAPAYIFDTMDGTFPNHPPNPLEEENLRDLKDLVLANRLDVGVIYDGDGDRVMFIDELGRFVRPDIITAVLGLHFLALEEGYVLHDIRTSRAVIKYIRGLGGIPFMWKVGHSHAKVKMRELGAIYGGELAGHYYFREFFNCDSGILASVHVLNILAGLKRSGGRLSSLVDAIDTMFNSGEVNFRIEDKSGAMESLLERFTADEEPLEILDYDGYRVEFASWWFNVRPSNTEPYLRLVVEANSEDLLQEKMQEMNSILSGFMQGR